jgi:CRISPR system Cascade subunit CasA
MLNILTEPLIRYHSLAGNLEASLPEVYAALMADEVIAFPALRPHQRHAWHAFLVQLGAMAMHRVGLNTPPETAEEWTGLIRGLTIDFPEDEPWQVAVENITKPAFMQPPATSKGREKDYKTSVATPDELDMLVTSKNHDLKTSVAFRAGLDDWIFALITLQTMEGFGGAGNYGISRMNGGLGNRSAFSLAPSGLTPGPHIQRDIRALLEFREAILERNTAYPSNNGIPLLWTFPWDGSPAEALLPNRLDVFYIEVCRRVRLLSDSDGQLYGLRTSSKAARIESKDLKGRMGDPWTPSNSKRDGLPLTLSAGGFNYKRVTDYLTSTDWSRSQLLLPTKTEQRSRDEMQLVARAMVRGQGKTEGYHERVIPIAYKTKIAMLNPDATQDLGEIAKSRIEEVGKVQRILSHAIQVFAARGDETKVTQEQRNLARPWLNRLEQIVDDDFFEHLQAEFEVESHDRVGIRNQWLKDFVIGKARNVLREAEDSLPCPAINSYRARVNSEGLFESRIRGRNGFPGLFHNQGGE